MAATADTAATSSDKPSSRDLLEQHLRQRTAPRLGDELYLHLADLRLALREALAGARGDWLDYGAGTAPYRDLLPDARLVTADVAGAEALALDYVLGPQGECPCADATFDGVLSTQVLEHVAEPAAYLAEAFRVLKPAGRLVLSTHGIWEDHGFDLWRWTADGLRETARAARFDVDRVRKVTSGERAAIMFLRRVFATAPFPRGGVVGGLFAALQTLDSRFAALDRYAERHLRRHAIDRGDGVFYIGIVLQAHRPT